MEHELSVIEVRVLGALVEKELATPEYYPLTLNSLTTACNQKSNRDPVLNIEEVEVVRALDSLKLKQYVVLSAEGGRVPRYRHILSEKLKLKPAELAVLAELFLRGPQTLGELRGRAERLHVFADAGEAETVVNDLGERGLVTKLPRQPGRKESRFAHMFSGEPKGGEGLPAVQPEAARLRVIAENERMTQLEEEVSALREEIKALRNAMEEFKAQFD